MRSSAVVCLLIAGTLCSQSIYGQQRGGRDNNANAQGGGRGPGGPGGGGGRGPGGGGFGGPGGMGAMRGMIGGGGMMGRLGSSIAFIINSEAVQKELKLTDKQKEEIKEAQQKQQDNGRKAFEAMREQGQQNRGAQGGQGGRGNRGGFDPAAMSELFDKLAKEGEVAYKKILTSEQFKRINEIALQVEGPSGIFERPDLSKKLNITQQQFQAHAKLKSQVDANRRQIFEQSGLGFGGPGGFGGGPGGGGPGRGQAGQTAQGGAQAQQAQGGRGTRGGQAGGNAQPGGGAQGGNAQQGGRPDPRNMSQEERTKFNEERAKSLEKMRDETNKLRDKADAAMIKLLTKRQTEAYKKMIGKEFDVDSVMTTMQGPQGAQRGRRGGPVD
jgi:hypothetical protein